MEPTQSPRIEFWNFICRDQLAELIRLISYIASVTGEERQRYILWVAGDAGSPTAALVEMLATWFRFTFSRQSICIPSEVDSRELEQFLQSARYPSMGDLKIGNLQVSPVHRLVIVHGRFPSLLVAQRADVCLYLAKASVYGEWLHLPANARVFGWRSASVTSGQ